MTSMPAARAASTVARAASKPPGPTRSKHALWSLAATQASPAAWMTARHWASMRAAGEAVARARSTSGQTRAGSGSSPRTIWDERSATAAARRSAKRPVRLGSVTT
jgi:hypothetical protein